MNTSDGFDQFGQYSNLELQHKLHKLKFNNINNFIEASINKNYNLYKKNKKSNITFMDYRSLMLKELEKHTNKKDKKKDSKKNNTSISEILSMLSEEENSLWILIKIDRVARINGFNKIIMYIINITIS